MKRIIAIVLVVLLTGCAAKQSIVGTWEQEMTISVIGMEEQTEAESTARFTFRQDGTGTQEQLLFDGVHPNTLREFTWTLSGECVILDFGNGRQETFVVIQEKDSLELHSQRIIFELKKVK